MNVDMPTVCVRKGARLHIKGRDACDFTDEINLSPCASAPFYMSQDRIHLRNVTVLQLLELEEKIHFVFDTRKTSKKCTHFLILSRMSRIFALFQASLMLAANFNAGILGQF